MKPETEEEDDGLYAFDRFDIENVVKRGSPLLASAGKEFDMDVGDMDPKERIALQKKQLKQKLGLGTEFMDGGFCSSFPWCLSIGVFDTVFVYLLQWISLTKPMW